MKVRMNTESCSDFLSFLSKIKCFLKKKRSLCIFILQFFKFRSQTRVNSKIIIINLILPKYFTLYIIYKKTSCGPQKKAKRPTWESCPQVENYWNTYNKQDY